MAGQLGATLFDMLAKEDDAASSSHHEQPFGDGQPLDQRMGEDELLHIIGFLQDGVLAFALVCTAFRNAVYLHLGSVHIRSICAQVVQPSMPDPARICTSARPIRVSSTRAGRDICCSPALVTGPGLPSRSNLCSRRRRGLHGGPHVRAHLGIALGRDVRKRSPIRPP